MNVRLVLDGVSEVVSLGEGQFALRSPVGSLGGRQVGGVTSVGFHQQSTQSQLFVGVSLGLVHLVGTPEGVLAVGDGHAGSVNTVVESALDFETGVADGLAGNAADFVSVSVADGAESVGGGVGVASAVGAGAVAGHAVDHFGRTVVEVDVGQLGDQHVSNARVLSANQSSTLHDSGVQGSGGAGTSMTQAGDDGQAVAGTGSSFTSVQLAVAVGIGPVQVAGFASGAVQVQVGAELVPVGDQAGVDVDGHGAGDVVEGNLLAGANAVVQEEGEGNSEGLVVQVVGGTGNGFANNGTELVSTAAGAVAVTRGGLGEGFGLNVSGTQVDVGANHGGGGVAHAAVAELGSGDHAGAPVADRHGSGVDDGAVGGGAAVSGAVAVGVDTQNGAGAFEGSEGGNGHHNGGASGNGAAGAVNSDGDSGRHASAGAGQGANGGVAQAYGDGGVALAGGATSGQLDFVVGVVGVDVASGATQLVSQEVGHGALEKLELSGSAEDVNLVDSGVSGTSDHNGHGSQHQGFDDAIHCVVLLKREWLFMRLPTLCGQP